MENTGSLISKLTRQIARLEERIEKFEEREKLYLPLVENSQDILYRTDLQGKIIYISSSVYKLSGYTVEEAIGMNMAEEVYVYPEQRQEFIDQLQRNGVVANFSAQLKRKDGSIWWAMTNAHFHHSSSGEIIGVEGITRDITDLVESAEALIESEERFKSIIDSSPMGVHLYCLEDEDLIFSGYNKAADRILGIDHSGFSGSTLEEAFPSLVDTEIPDKYRAVCSTGRSWQSEHVEYEDNSISGAYEVYTFQTSPGKMAAFFLDITERKKAEEEKRLLQRQLLQAQKMEAVGTLAGGIAHDFNNILMGIQGRVSLALINNSGDSQTHEHLVNIEKYIQSAVELTRQLLGFARGGKYEVKAVDINDLLTSSGELFGRTKKEIHIHYLLDKDLRSVEGDKQQLHQVLLNLYVNSWQAMPQGGDISLKTANTTLTEQSTGSYGLPAGPYVHIEVIDTGTGIDKDILDKIFEPFFTTKEKSWGTGLGLASVYGIIQNHNGIITVDSETGKGAAFSIYLPASSEPVVPQIDGNGDLEMQGGSESILLVDDEEIILQVGSEMLTSLGYSVTTAHSGQKALEYYLDNVDQVDLVILDMVMPDMDGSKTFQLLTKINPHVTVLLSSGYSLAGKASELLSLGCRGFIQKPFNMEELAGKVRECLG